MMHKFVASTLNSTAITAPFSAMMGDDVVPPAGWQEVRIHLDRDLGAGSSHAFVIKIIVIGGGRALDLMYYKFRLPAYLLCSINKPYLSSFLPKFNSEQAAGSSELSMRASLPNSITPSLNNPILRDGFQLL